MKIFKKIIVLASFVMTGIVYAQPGTVVGTGSGQPNDIVSITIDYLGTGSGVVGIQMDVNFDNVNLAADITSCGGTLGGANISCTDNGTFIRLIGFDGALAEIPSGSLGTIDFTIAAAAVVPSTLALTLTGELYGDNLGNPVATVGSVEGAVMVVAGPQPDYSSAPVGGTTLALTGSIGTNPTADVDISNIGPVGAGALTGTCALSGGDAASFSIVTATAINVAQGAAAQTMTVDCDATAATAATLNASLDCTHNGDGTTEASPVSYPLTCDILAISPQYDSTPVGGTAILLGSVLQGGANPTGLITINNDNGDATTTLTGTCTAPAPFSVTAGGAFNVLQGAAAVTVDFDCDASAAPGMYTEDLSCTHNGSNVASPVTYPMSCEVVAPVSTGNPVGGSSSNASIIVPPGGSNTNTVITFSETSNQGLDITDLNCTLATGTDFAVVTAMPATIPAGGSIGVEVSFTDPATGGPYADVMTCTYTDSGGVQSVVVNLTGTALAVVVPTLSTMGYVAMMFALLLVGFFGFRRRV